MRQFLDLLRRLAHDQTPLRAKCYRLILEPLEDRCTPAEFFLQTNLVSDIPGLARFTDPHLIAAAHARTGDEIGETIPVHVAGSHMDPAANSGVIGIDRQQHRWQENGLELVRIIAYYFLHDTSESNSSKH